MPTPTLSNSQIADIWSRKYQGTNNPEKTERALKVLDRDSFRHVPFDAQDAIRRAVDLHGGDMGVSHETLQRVLTSVGRIESNFSTRIQAGGGPARGFWQVEPDTARDLMKNSRPLFGPKWKMHFGSDKLNELAAMNDADLSKAIEDDDELAASFAAAKIQVAASDDIRAAIRENQKETKENAKSTG